MSEKLEYLEILLKDIANSCSREFPVKEDNYYDKYQNITNHLKRNVYDEVNTGLAANSEEQGLYTDHGKEHFDSVIYYAGQMLGLHTNKDISICTAKLVKSTWVLKPYELYLLLLGIRFHDVGNIYGREDHEKNIMKVIIKFKVPHLHYDRVESKKIAIIGGAHGGKTKSGSKDTINALPDTSRDGGIDDLNLKKIAAIIRFADEICENRQRTSMSFADFTPEHNKIFHIYANSIISNIVKEQVLHLEFQINHDNLHCNYFLDKDGCKQSTLENMFLERIIKTEIERRYCSRFLSDGIAIKEIQINVSIIKYEEYDIQILGKHQFTLKERNYPGNDGEILPESITNFLKESFI